MQTSPAATEVQTAPTETAVAKKVAPKAVAKRVSKPAAKAPVKAVAKKVAAKPAVKAAAKTPAKKVPVKAAAKPAAKPAAAPKAPAAAKPPKEKKIKMVRDSISIPKTEYAVLDDLKVRAGKLGVSVKKTELIRAGIKALAALGDTGFLASVRAVPSLKTGRPAKAE